MQSCLNKVRRILTRSIQYNLSSVIHATVPLAQSDTCGVGVIVTEMQNVQRTANVLESCSWIKSEDSERLWMLQFQRVSLRRLRIYTVLFVLVLVIDQFDAVVVVVVAARCWCGRETKFYYYITRNPLCILSREATELDLRCQAFCYFLKPRARRVARVSTHKYK